MKRIRWHDLQYYRFDLLDEINHGIFTRHGGDSPAPWHGLNVGSTVGDSLDTVQANLRQMYAALEMNQDRACSTWQIHGRDVIRVEQPMRARKWIAKADGMVTNNPDTPLSMRFADCVPLLFHDPIQQVVGIAHAGWRGTVQGIGSATVETMVQEYGSRAQDVRVGIGPSISQQHFQVGEEVVAAFRERFATADDLIARDPNDGTAYIDLWAANVLDVQAAGVQQIEVAEMCTYANTDEFFSHRAEQGKTGRFGALISL